MVTTSTSSLRPKTTKTTNFSVRYTIHGGYLYFAEIGQRLHNQAIEVKLGSSLILQMHRIEHWVVVNGSDRVINVGREILINTIASPSIPADHKHRLTKTGAAPCVMIEVQSV